MRAHFSRVARKEYGPHRTRAPRARDRVLNAIDHMKQSRLPIFGEYSTSVVVFLDNGHRDSANTHDIVKTQSDRLRAITGVYPSSAALRPQRLRREASAVTPGVGAVASRRSALIHRERAGRPYGSAPSPTTAPS